MTGSSLHALVCDLAGEEPAGTEVVRPTVSQALRRVQPGEVVAARRGRRKLCVARLPDGRAFVMPDRCPHDGGFLSDGFIEGSRLVCARHGWEFDLQSGHCPMRAGATIDVVELSSSRPPRRR